MKNMTLKEITAACGGVYHGSQDYFLQEVSSVTIDSRKIKNNCLFVAIRGERVDGHSFIPQVMENGALCAISEERFENAEFSYILVDSCEQALKDIAEHYRTSLGIKVVGISGSVGKTSTKEMIASILGEKFNVLKTEGNLNNEIGLPLTIFNITQEHEIAVLEMGISEFGEMERLAKVACPDICVITNIGYAHLENLKSREGILKAKTSMFQFMNPNGSIILNGEDDMLSTVKPFHGTNPVFFGLSDSNKFYATDIQDLGLEGTSACFHTPDSSFTAHIPIPGFHMVLNALAGIAAGRILGMTDIEIKNGIENTSTIAGRNHLIKTKHLSIIDDCYNANIVSMKASLDVLSKAIGRKVAILGDMFELGEKEKEMHYETGQYAASLNIDELICIGDLAKEMADGAKSSSNITEIHYFKTKQDFLDTMNLLINENDTILVKASNGMKFSQLVEALEKFE